jgi:hypothetical protein
VSQTRRRRFALAIASRLWAGDDEGGMEPLLLELLYETLHFAFERIAIDDRCVGHIKDSDEMGDSNSKGN